MKSKPDQAGWLEQHGTLIGKLPDEVVAQRVGKSRGYIKKIRLERGIHFNRKLRPWTPEEERLLGKYTDREVGRLLVRDIRAVANRRRALGRPPCGGSYNLWADYERDLLGTAPDREVARQLKRSLASVQCARARLEVPLEVSALHQWSKEEISLLGKLADEEPPALACELPRLDAVKRRGFEIDGIENDVFDCAAYVAHGEAGTKAARVPSSYMFRA